MTAASVITRYLRRNPIIFYWTLTTPFAGTKVWHRRHKTPLMSFPVSRFFLLSLNRVSAEGTNRRTRTHSRQCIVPLSGNRLLVLLPLNRGKCYSCNSLNTRHAALIYTYPEYNNISRISPAEELRAALFSFHRTNTQDRVSHSSRDRGERRTRKHQSHPDRVNRSRCPCNYLGITLLQEQPPTCVFHFSP